MSHKNCSVISKHSASDSVNFCTSTKAINDILVRLYLSSLLLKQFSVLADTT